MSYPKNINLMPWRGNYYQQKLIGFVKKSAVMFCLLTFILFINHSLYQFLFRQIQPISTNNHSIRLKIKQGDNQLQHLKKQVNFNQTAPFTPQSQWLTFWQVLASLPFEQGELSKVTVSIHHDNQLQLNIQGNAMNQAEFEALYHYMDHFFQQQGLSVKRQLETFELTQPQYAFFSLLFTLDKPLPPNKMGE